MIDSRVSAWAAAAGRDGGRRKALGIVVNVRDDREWGKRKRRGGRKGRGRGERETKYGINRKLKKTTSKMFK